uniref:Reverse transcriptase domain-containing protein n=1 Tax=Tanacetum cinerariifolium TaxID=118510 RepID=A0A6L2MN04_TANCI|nr:reverse transcriptase domain-containing protein [Tanacetum cinerariifolium]
MLKKRGIASWAPFLDNRGSGDGERLVPIGFEGCCWGKRGEKVQYRIGREMGYTVFVQSVSNCDRVIGIIGNGDLPVPDLQTMEELFHPSLNGRGGPSAPIAIQATNFGLKNEMIQQVQNSCQFHGLPGDDANNHLEKFMHVTQSIKVNGVTDDALPQRSESSSSITSSSGTEITALIAEMAEINKNLMRVLQVNQQVKAVTPNCETFDGPHSFSDCPATIGQTQNVYATGAYQGNTITNPKEDLKGITTRSGTAYQGPMIPTTSYSLPLVVERETVSTKDTVHPTNNGSTKDVQPPVIPTESLIQNSEPVFAPIIEPVASPVSAPKLNQRPSIPYPSRFHDQNLRDKANDQRDNFFQIFKDLNFNISFADALILMPKFGPSIKSLLTNKDKLFELARTPLNEHCSAILLKKLPEKLRDPANINLMPLSMWNKLSLPDLSPTCMTLELADRLISCPVGVAEDVFIKVGTFDFPADFVVVDFNADPRVPLILRRSFLKTERALIDVFEGELTLRVGREAITFNLDQTLRYSANYNDMTVNQIDVIDMACEEYSQEVLGFSDVIAKEDFEPMVQHQRRVNPKIHNVIKNEVLKLFDAGLIYPISDSPWMAYVHRLSLFLNPINLKDQEKTTFTCLYGTFAYRCMPFGLCNASGTFQRCMMSIFHHMIEKTIEVFMDEFTVFENSFQTCLSHLEKMLKQCEDTNLCLNWEKSHFMVKEGIVLGHKISKNRIEVDKAKVDVIAKLPHPTTLKGIRSFLGHAGFYQRFIKDFSKIAWPMTRLLDKDTPFFFSKEYVEAFQKLKRKLTKAPILIALDWDFPFELMCDASDFVIGAVLRQRQEKHFRPIHYASKTMTKAESNYITTE